MNKARRAMALAAAAMALLATSGCANLSVKNVGALVGAGAGIAVGSVAGSGVGQVAAMAVGGIVGAAVGESLDRQDEALRREAHHRALAEGRSERLSWHNPRTGHRGTVEVDRRGGGKDCVDYRETIHVGREVRKSRGQACQVAGGVWRLADGVTVGR